MASFDFGFSRATRFDRDRQIVIGLIRGVRSLIAVSGPL
jgi:hypothetical protein